MCQINASVMIESSLRYQKYGLVYKQNHSPFQISHDQLNQFQLHENSLLYLFFINSKFYFRQKERPLHCIFLFCGVMSYITKP